MKKFYFVFLFIFVEIFTFTILYINYKSKEKTIINLETQLAISQYKIINDSFTNLANSVFYGYINKPKIIDLFKKKQREKLYTVLSKDYKYLRTIGFTQIHFHLPNNHSFLRLHKPNIYNDDLTNSRYSVNYVNKYKKKISGLEMGKIFPGFRYVYPLFEHGKYIGSVENSLGIEAFTNRLEKLYNIKVHFIIDKKIFNKKVFNDYKKLYEDSIEHSNYILLKDTKQTFNKRINEEIKKAFQNKLKNKINDKIKNQKTFSIELKVKNENKLSHKIVTFLQLKNIENKNIGYFVIYKKNNKLEKIEEEVTKEYFAFSLINILVFLLIYREMSKKSVLRKIVKEKTLELNLLNSSLKEKIKNEVLKSKKQEEKLHEYEKMADMAELIGNIAHQWRQPLSAISVSASGLKIADELNILKKEDINEYTNVIIKNTKYLSNTIDIFSEYISGNSKEENINIQYFLNQTLNFEEANLKNHNIKIIRDIDEKNPIYKNIVTIDLSQILIILLSNAKDALINHNIKNPQIKISLKKFKNYFTINIEDNGKGIDSKIINKIFDPYFTTKHQAQGVGLGLHIARRIAINKLKAELKIENSNIGVCATIKIPY